VIHPLATVGSGPVLAEQIEKRTRDGKPVKTVDGKTVMTWRATARVHDLRHTYASILASEGLSLPIIGALLGDTQAQITARYAHLLDDPLRAATERVGALITGRGAPTAEVPAVEPGTMGVVDVSSATGGEWGSVASKEATAFIHKIAALVPGTYASVFCSEAWALRANSKGELNRQNDKYPNMGDHPDRDEVMMFQMLHYEIEANTMMQQSTMIEILKVLGANRSRETWRHTKLSDDVKTSDPHSGKEGYRMTGRFIFGDPENP